MKTLEISDIQLNICGSDTHKKKTISGSAIASPSPNGSKSEAEKKKFEPRNSHTFNSTITVYSKIET